MARPKKPKPWVPKYKDWSPPEIPEGLPTYVENPRFTFVRNFNRILEVYRQKTGRGLRSMCSRTGLSRSNVQRLAKGTYFPEPETLQKLAWAMGVKVEDFFRQDL
jgi:ribosome-binding protein aMBF1 (putative translation factor)